MSADSTLIEAPSLTLTVFSKNDCSICTQTEKYFARKGVPFTEINVQEDLDPRDEFGGRTPLDHVKETFGLQMPAVVITDSDGWVVDSWTGGRMDKWSATVARFEETGLLIPEHERQAA